MRDVAFAKIPRAFHGLARQSRRIGGGDFTAAGVPAVEVRQLGPQDGRLHFVHAAIATIFGGLILAAPSVLAQRVRSLRQYGWSSKYRCSEYGRNSRMDEMQAAILRAKLPHLDGWNA